MSRRADILVIGPFPPPVHGYSVVTAFMAERLAAVANVEAVNIAPDSLVRNRRYHAQRIGRVAKGLWRLIAARHRTRRLYSAIAGGAGIVYDLALVLTARLLGYRIYIHHHSFSYINRWNRWTALLLAIGGRATTHICLSASMARRLGTLYPRARNFIVVSNAALTPPGPPRSAHTGPIRLGFLGNLIPDKGIDTAIAVAKALRNDGRDIVLVVAGPTLDPATKSLLSEAQHDLGAAFDYRGALYGTAKSAFLDSLDVLLFPTRYANEAQPLVVLEALAVGVPVLATNYGAISEDVGRHGGVFADQDYVEESVRAITAWCTDRNRLAELSADTKAHAVDAYRSAQEGLAGLLRDVTRM